MSKPTPILTPLAEMEEHDRRMYLKMGFDTDEKIRVRWHVLNLIHEKDSYFVNLWHLTDAYGYRGYLPPQGYDWSGFRDSSWDSIADMADILQVFYGEEVVNG